MNPRLKPPQPNPVPDRCDPADANTNWVWIREVVTKLGLTVLAVESSANPQKSNWPGFHNLIGQKFEAASLGVFDSSKLGEPTHWYFCVTTERLAEALNLVKSELASLNLLDQVKIGHADPEAGVWRMFHPGVEGKA